MGFADSRKQARQLVRHGHFVVNGRKTDIPSYLTRAGDAISVRLQSREREYFKTAAEVLLTRQVPAWLTLDPANQAGTVLNEPARDQIDMPPINEALIVEFYSR